MKTVSVVVKAFSVVVFSVFFCSIWIYYAVLDYKRKKIVNFIFDAVMLLLLAFCAIFSIIVIWSGY